MPIAQVRVREIESQGFTGLQYFQDVAISGPSRPTPNDQLQAKWQSSLQLLTKILDADLGRITQISESAIQVITLSDPDKFPNIERTLPLGLASYSETIIGTNSSLYIEDAQKIPLWAHNFDLKSGFHSIIGVPLEWPGHETFGSFEILSQKPMILSEIQQELIGEFQESILSDLRQLHLEAQLEFYSTLDPLTQVSTRRIIQEQLEAELRRAKRTRSPFAVALVHLQNLKEINLEQGNPAGDATLEEVATAICDTCRETDSVGRWSDAHFLLICPETGTAGIQTLKSKLETEIENFSFSEKVKPHVETQWTLIEGKEKTIEEILHLLKF